MVPTGMEFNSSRQSVLDPSHRTNLRQPLATEKPVRTRNTYTLRHGALRGMIVAMNEHFKFDAVIMAGDGGGAFIFFPFDMLISFGTTAKVPVDGTIDGVPFTGKLFKYGFPQHILGVLKSLRSQIGKKPGDTVRITLKRAD